MISTEDFGWFVNRTLDQMVAIVEQLGDEQVCTRPDLDQTNSVYGIVTHCLGVTASWAGSYVAGRSVERDRDHEFSATGSVAELVARIDTARAQFAIDLAMADPAAPLRVPGPASLEGTPILATQGGALLHLYEELVQHLGQMELTRDVLLGR